MLPVVRHSLLLQACLAAHNSGITHGWGHHCPHISPAELMSDAAGMPAPAQQQQLLGQVTPHLPAPAPAAQPGPQLQAALTRLNLAWAKLLAKFLPAAYGDVPGEIPCLLACLPTTSCMRCLLLELSWTQLLTTMLPAAYDGSSVRYVQAGL